MRNRIKSYRQFTLVTALFLFLFTGKAFSQAASVSLGDATAGVATTYTISFTLNPLDNLPDTGTVSLTFNAGFTLGDPMTITSVGANVIDGGWDSPSPVDQTITFTRDGTGTDLSGGIPYVIDVSTVTNSQTTGNAYNVQLITSGSAVVTNVTSSNFTITPAALNSFTITDEPATVTAGTPFGAPANNITVTAFDQYNNQKTDYTGTVTWSSSDAHGSVSLPADIAFTGASETFSGNDFTLITAGTQTLTVTDNAASVNETSDNITVAPAALNSFTITGEPATVTAGTPFGAPANNITVTAFDQYNNQKTNYTGTVTWSSSDAHGSVSLPADIAFTGASETFSGNDFTLITAGTQTLTVTDNAASVNETSDNITVAPAALNSFTITGEPATVTAGTPFGAPANNITVTAFDQYNNQKTNYTGTVTWSSSDAHGSVSLPADIAFTGASETFSGNDFTLITAGTQTLTVTDNAASVNETSDNITVAPAALNSFTITGEPATVTAGTPFGAPANNITVTAFDQYNNQKTNYTGTVTWSSSDAHGSVSLPADIAFTGASETFSGNDFTLITAGTQTLTVTDNAASVNETSDNITVAPAALNSFTITGEPATVTAGTPFGAPANNITVTAFDQYNNQKTNYTGTVTWSSSDAHGSVSLPADIAFTGASETFSGNDFTLITAGTQTLTVTDNAASVNETSDNITVNATIIASFDIEPTTVDDKEAGVDFTVEVTNAVDAFGNAASGDVTVSFQDGGTHMVPNGESPTLRKITVTNGTGSENQTLVLRETGVVLRGDADGTVANDVTTSITVQAGPIENFTLTLPSGQINAGVAFTLSVENARDGFNNEADGVVTIGFQDAIGNHLSPNSDSPVLNNITVTSGEGDANQTLYLAETTFLRGTSGAATDDTPNFTVLYGVLNSYTIDPISTPQVAGTAFSVSVSDAHDQYGNDVSNETIAISFTDGGTTSHNAPNGIPYTLQSISISNGSGNASQTMVRAESNVQLRGTGNGQIVDSNQFDVNPANSYNSIAVYSGGGGNTGPVSTSLNVGDTLTVHAVGFDIYQNFTDGLNVNWSVIGATTIGTLSVSTGTSTILTATTLGSGQINATHSGSGLSAQTGLINVIVSGNITSIIIRDAAGGAGSPVGDLPTLTADDSRTFYAAGYEGSNYVQEVSVNWTLQSGDLDFTPQTNTSYFFNPSTAPTSGIIHAEHVASGATDVTGTITVSPGQLASVKVLQAGVGNTGEIPPQSVQPGQEIDVKAGGFDAEDNYRSDESVTWSAVPSALGTMTPSSGTNSTFRAVTSGQSGEIKADHPTVTDGFSGQITVQTGAVDSIDIRTGPGGGGVSLTTYTLSADDSVTLYAAGYDVLGQYVNDVTVTWRSEGTIDTLDSVAETGPSVEFSPRWAPANGEIKADHNTAKDDSITVTVTTGAPVGPITLTPNPEVLQANGVETSTVTSNALLDADGNLVGSGKEFDIDLINPVLGSLTDDTNGSLAGTQDTTNASSQLEFTFAAGLQPGTQNIIVNSNDGDLSGQTSITLGSLRIVSIGNAPEFASRGQQDIPNIQMVVQNLTPTEVTAVAPLLTFNSGTATGFSQTKTDAFTTIPASGSRTFTFAVDIAGNATLGQIVVDGEISGQIGGQPVTSSGSQTTDTLLVQRPAELAIVSVFSVLDTVAQGNENIDVTVRLRNTASLGAASAVVDMIDLKFLYQGLGDSASFFPNTPSGANPVSVGAGQDADFVYQVNVGASAPIGDYALDASVAAHDTNSTGLSLTDNQAATTDSWHVKAASNLQIVSLTPSVPAVRSGQQDPNWTVTMEVSNNGADPINVNLAQTFIEFFIGATPVTNQYTIVPPTEFVNSGDQFLGNGVTDFLVFTIDETGTTVGQARIRGTINGTDTGTNNPISDNTNDGGEGEVAINSADDAVVISNTNPSIGAPNSGPSDGTVDTGQVFNIRVEVTNELQEPIVNVNLSLSTDGESIITNPTAVIDSIGPGDESTIDFEITADSDALLVERFTAELLSATGFSSNQPAPIKEPDSGDDYVEFEITTPADLSLSIDVDQFQTASDTFEVRGIVENSGGGRIDASGRITLTLPDNYTLYTDGGGADSPAQFTNQTTEVIWEVVAPNDDSENDTLFVAITQDPIARNTGNPALVSVRSDTQIVETRAVGLTINQFSIISPEGATDDTLSTDQPFDIQADFTISPNIDSVEARLFLAAGYSLISGNPLQIITEGSITDTTASWSLVAASDAHEARNLIVNIEAFANGISRAVQVDTVTVFADRKAELTFESFQPEIGIVESGGRYRLSTNQRFKLFALILNNGDAGVIGTGQLRLDLANTGIVSEDPLVQDYTPNTQVEWNVVAPDSVSPSKAITVTHITETRPDDENTNELAAVGGSSQRSINIETGDFGRLAIDSLYVTQVGARDGTVSTDQVFTLNADITYENTNNVSARLIPLGGFGVSEGTKNNLGNGSGEVTVNWQVTAPNIETAPVFLQLEVNGIDVSQNEPVATASDSVSFSAVAKAELSLEAEITAPASATDNGLTEGQEFTVTASYRQSGIASVSGQDTVVIDLPQSFRLRAGQIAKQAITTSNPVDWVVIAPAVAHEVPRTIAVDVINRQTREQNTNDPPPLSPQSVDFSVTTRATALVTRILDVSTPPKTVPLNKANQPVLALEFENQNDEGIEIKQFNFRIKNADGDTIPPNTILSAMRVVDYLDPSNVLAAINSMPASNPVSFNFNDEITIAPFGGLNAVEFRVDLLSQSDVTNFQVLLEFPSRRDIIARVVNADTVLITDENGTELRASSPLARPAITVIGSSMEESFFNYPNPFGASEKITSFNINVTQTTDISIRIYTLLGRLVTKIERQNVAPGNYDNLLNWDGTNGDGNPVLNGIYVAVLTTNYGTTVTKIAVAR